MGEQKQQLSFQKVQILMTFVHFVGSAGRAAGGTLKSNLQRNSSLSTLEGHTDYFVQARGGCADAVQIRQIIAEGLHVVFVMIPHKRRLLNSPLPPRIGIYEAFA